MDVDVAGTMFEMGKDMHAEIAEVDIELTTATARSVSMSATAYTYSYSSESTSLFDVVQSAYKSGTQTKKKRHAEDASHMKQQRLLNQLIHALETLPCRQLSSASDPFDILPAVTSEDAIILGHHYNTAFISTAIPPGPRSEWFSFAIADPILYQGTLTISASHLASVHKGNWWKSFYHHRGETIRQVNQRLLLPDTASNDGTICAIAFLLVTDSLAADDDAVRAHLSGLVELLSMRGGLENIHHLIQRTLRWVDLLSAIVLLRRPIFEPVIFNGVDYRSLYGPPSLSTTEFATTFETRLLNYTGYEELCSIASRIFWGLRNVSLLKNKGLTSDSPSEAGLYYSDRIEFLEREVQMLLHSPRLRFLATLSTHHINKKNPNQIFIIFSLAALVYIYSFLRDHPSVPLIRKVASLLRHSIDIDETDLNVLLGTFPELMLWVLFLGGEAARKSEKIWFAKAASRVLRVQKVDQEPAIMSAASAFLWPEGRANYVGFVATNAENLGCSSSD